MFVTSRFRITPGQRPEFLADAERALEVLLERIGCVAGRLGQAVDDPGLWALSTQWESVGAYRRALSHYDVKLHAVPLMYRALDEPSAYVTVLDGVPGGALVHSESPVADDPLAAPGRSYDE